MARKVDLTSETITRQQRKNRTLGTQTPLASTTVERGSTHWTDGSNVNIDGLLGIAGTGTVTGYLGITGTLNASGQINLSGSTAITGPLNVTGTTTIGGNTNITGELNVTGPTTLDGILDIGGDTTITGQLDVTGPMATKGTLSVEGKTTLKNDLNVTAEGRVLVGDLVIDQSSPGGNIGFAGGGITSGGTGFRVTATTKDAVLESTASGGNARITAGGSTVTAKSGAVELNALKTTVSGALEVSGRTDLNGATYLNNAQVWLINLPSTGNPPNLHITSGGRIYRSTWTPPA